MTKILMVLLSLATLGAGFALGRMNPPVANGSSQDLQSQYLARAHDAEIAVDVLSFLDEGDTANARVMLEGHLRSALLFLQATSSSVQMPVDQQKLISETIDKGERYLEEAATQRTQIYGTHMENKR